MGYLKWYLDKNREKPEGLYSLICDTYILTRDVLSYLKKWIISFILIYVFLFVFFGEFINYVIFKTADTISYFFSVWLFTILILCIIWMLKESIVKSYKEYKKTIKKS